MITYRRLLLDEALRAAEPLMRGRVLDVGGKKANKRGTFRPPARLADAWRYLNPDPSTEPDYVGGAEDIPVPEGSFDTVLMTEVLEYLPEPAAALAEIQRVLSPGGALILTSPLLCPVHGDWEGDRQRFTEVKLRDMAARARFSVEAISPMGGLGAVIYDLLYAACGYARPGGRPARLRRRLLRLSFPCFRMLDARTRSQSRYVNTGYFAVFRKPGAA